MNRSFYDVLTAHALAYPAMQPQDYCKLVFQNEFGCGHLLSDREAAFRRLREELASVQNDDTLPLCTGIGGGYVRMNLAAVKDCLPTELIFSLFALSCAETGSTDSFRKKLALTVKAAQTGIISADPAALEEYFSSFDPTSPPSHSEIFKRTYGASYRLIRSDLAALLPLCMRIVREMNEGGEVTVALEGRAASGKSTAAANLSRLFDANVIHMDDFFLPAVRKTPERLAVPGGNIDSERFREEVFDHIGEEKFSYRVFDCSKQALTDTVTVNRKPLLIVEGVYSLLPAFRDRYRIKVFTDTDPRTQAERILRRGGEALYHRYASEWLPLEEIYFRALNPAGVCDIRINT